MGINLTEKEAYMSIFLEGDRFFFSLDFQDNRYEAKVLTSDRGKWFNIKNKFHDGNIDT